MTQAFELKWLAENENWLCRRLQRKCATEVSEISYCLMKSMKTENGRK